MSAFVRETQIVRRDVKGEQMKDIELNVMTEGRKMYYSSGRGRVRRNLTAPKQAQLNDKHAWIYFGRLLDMNFGKGDYRVTMTYKNKFRPATFEDAKKDFDRFVVRLKKLYRECGVPLRWVMVMSFASGKNGEPVRIHFHPTLSGGVDRNAIEKCWRAPDKPGRCRTDASEAEKEARLGERLGYINCDSLQTEGGGLAAHCEYMKKQPREGIARRWYASVGLKKPYVRSRNDDKYDFADLKAICENNADVVDVKWWERHYPGWTVCEPHEYAYTRTDSEFSGVSIRMKLRKLTEREIEERKRARRANPSVACGDSSLYTREPKRKRKTVGEHSICSRKRKESAIE